MDEPLRVSSDAYGVARPQVTVVVATHDRCGFLEGLMDALAAQKTDRPFDVVVVDDASADDTWAELGAIAGRTGLALRAVRLPEAGGAGRARNMGVAEARSQVVAFTDDDCLPSAEWLEALTAPLLDPPGGAPPLVVQGRTTPWPSDAEAGGPWARTVWVLGPTWLFEACNVAYRRVDLDAAGGFPTKDAPTTITGRPAGEDALLGWRVVELGAELVFRPDALVHHRNFPASFLDHVREQAGRAVFPALAARSPMARRVFWARWFLAPRSAATVAALLSVMVAGRTGRRAWLVGAMPWALLAVPEARSRPGPTALRLAQVAMADLAGLAATSAGSVRHRALVL